MSVTSHAADSAPPPDLRARFEALVMPHLDRLLAFAIRRTDSRRRRRRRRPGSLRPRLARLRRPARRGQRAPVVLPHPPHGAQRHAREVGRGDSSSSPSRASRTRTTSSLAASTTRSSPRSSPASTARRSTAALRKHPRRLRRRRRAARHRRLQVRRDRRDRRRADRHGDEPHRPRPEAARRRDHGRARRRRRPTAAPMRRRAPHERAEAHDERRAVRASPPASRRPKRPRASRDTRSCASCSAPTPTTSSRRRRSRRSTRISSAAASAAAGSRCTTPFAHGSPSSRPPPRRRRCALASRAAIDAAPAPVAVARRRRSARAPRREVRLARRHGLGRCVVLAHRARRARRTGRAASHRAPRAPLATPVHDVPLLGGMRRRLRARQSRRPARPRARPRRRACRGVVPRRAAARRRTSGCSARGRPTCAASRRRCSPIACDDRLLVQYLVAEDVFFQHPADQRGGRRSPPASSGRRTVAPSSPGRSTSTGTVLVGDVPSESLQTIWRSESTADPVARPAFRNVVSDALSSRSRWPWRRPAAAFAQTPEPDAARDPPRLRPQRRTRSRLTRSRRGSRAPKRRSPPSASSSPTESQSTVHTRSRLQLDLTGMIITNALLHDTGARTTSTCRSIALAHRRAGEQRLRRDRAPDAPRRRGHRDRRCSAEASSATWRSTSSAACRTDPATGASSPSRASAPPRRRCAGRAPI